MGNPIDGKGPLRTRKKFDFHRSPPNPMDRSRICDIMVTGIRSIDGFRSIGKGQRMGIFSGSGVGKSVLMGMIARNCEADVNVVALIGERGREVKEFLEKDLGEEGLKRSVVVVSTADKPAIVRVKAAFLATGIAEYFRDQKKDVMLMMDSSTRIALAQREIGLAAGEPPTTRGYPPSVFAMLPRLFERSGMSHNGSITALYTVLVEGDDLDEPVSDAVRSVLDGHLVLSRELANRNHYPAIDVLASVSRCFTDIAKSTHKELVGKLLKSMAIYKDAEDMIQLGAYTKGSNPDLDSAIALHPSIENFLIQQIEEKSNFPEVMEILEKLQESA
jgi:flagellum-specific ATP synthase